jgi:hypothetical protein
LIVDVKKISTSALWGNRLINLSGILTPIVGIIVDYSGKVIEIKNPIQYAIFIHFKNNALWLYIALGVTFIIGWVISKNGKLICYKALQKLIDKLQFIAFPNFQNDVTASHRVTLFKYEKKCTQRYPLWNLYRWHVANKEGKGKNSGWLVPILRSGLHTKNTKTVFCVSNDSRQKTEGVAGQGWKRGAKLSLSNLPLITKSSGTTERSRYAQLTSMPDDMVSQYANNDIPLSRSIVSLPLMDCHGEHWGLIVVDSTEPDGIDEQELDSAYRAIIEPMGILIEELG